MRHSYCQLISQSVVRRSFGDLLNCRYASTVTKRRSYRSRNLCVPSLFSDYLWQRNHKYDTSARTHIRWFAFLPGDKKSTLSVIDSETNNSGTKSLHANIHYYLKRVPIGSMNEIDLYKARSFMFIVSKWKNEQGAKLSEALLERLYAEQSTKATVDTEMYNACMNAWNTSGIDGTAIVYNVERVFGRMKQRYNDENNPHAWVAQPDRASYNTLLNSYAKCDDDSSFKIHEILDKMNFLPKEENAHNSTSYIQPDEITYNTIMNYYATRTNQHYAAQQTEDILLQMSELSQQPNCIVQITSTSFNIAIKAWSNAGLGLDGAHRAKSLLLMMMKLHNRGHPNVEPTAISFSSVIDAYTKVPREDASTAVEMALELLDTMEASSISDVEHINSCYNAAANVFIKMQVKGAGERVRELMLRMKNMDAVPDEKMYSRCIEAYANEGTEEGFRIAGGVLDEMSAELGCNPSSVAFNSLLSALIKQHTGQSIKLAEELVHKMESLGEESRPDLATYNMIIGALSRNPYQGSEQKAVDYLRRMLRSYNSDRYSKAKPTSFVFNCIIAMLDRSEEEWAGDVMYNTLMSMENQLRQGNMSVIADTVTYNTVISKLSKKPTKNNAKKVMKLLAQMESTENAENKYAEPDIITYTNVVKMQEKLRSDRATSIASSYLKTCLAKMTLPPIDRIGLRTLLMSLSKSRKLEDANIILQTWLRIESNAGTSKILDREMCNLVLISFKNVKTDQSADRVLSFVSDRFKRHQDGEAIVMPTVIGLNAALSVLASSGRMNDVFSVMELMKAFSKKGDVHLNPDSECYKTVLSSLSGTKNSALYIEKVIRKARHDMDTVPISVINAAINAYIRILEDQIDKTKTIQVIFNMFEESKESHNEATYCLMIKACMKLSDNDEMRFKLIKRIFQLCAKNGMVSSKILKEAGQYKSILVANDIRRQK